MHLRSETTYDASPEEVFAMRSDPVWRARVCDAQRVVEHDISIEPDGDGFVLVNHQVQPTAGLPEIAKKFVGDTTRLVQREEWADRTGGTVTLEPAGVPAQVRGTITLRPSGTSTVELTEMDLKVKVPLLGKKLEAVLAGAVQAGLDAEAEAGHAWLRGEGR